MENACEQGGSGEKGGRRPRAIVPPAMAREPARLTLRLFGGFEARIGAAPASGLSSKKTRALLAYLAVPLGRAHARETLAALLWGGTSDAQARDNLRHALVELRRALAGTRPSSLVANGGALALHPPGVDVDVAAFEAHV